LKKESILALDTRNPARDSYKMQLSNFDVYEDPENGNILVVLERFDVPAISGQDSLEDSWYLIGVPPGK
jgi:hypothetical protein